MTGKRASQTKTGLMSTARGIALAVLTAVEADQAYSNIKLNELLRQSRLQPVDRAFATELVYGTLQRMNTLDFWLAPFLRQGVSRLEPWVRSLLRLSLYQLAYLDRIPAHAAVNEAVNLAKERGNPGAAGLVNAVLRRVLRQDSPFRLPADLSVAERMALEHSHPLWLVQRWQRQFGTAAAEAICRANNRPPCQSLRVNRLRNSPEALLARMQREAAGEYIPSPMAPEGILYRGSLALAQTEGFRSGCFTLQDVSSMLVAQALQPQPGQHILDACAAPGGKTTHLAERMEDEGEILAWDVYPHKLQLLSDNCARLGITCIRAELFDARMGQGRSERFDAVLLDAPCSGFGVIRRKPDLKWRRQERDLPELARLQRQLLEGVAPLVKPGGILVYSTCTMEEEENEENLSLFLQRHPEYSWDDSLRDDLPSAVSQKAAGSSGGWVRLLPHDFDSDGFFIARLKKEKA